MEGRIAEEIKDREEAVNDAVILKKEYNNIAELLAYQEQNMEKMFA